MEVFRAAVGTAPCRALPAVDLARADVLGPIQRDQHPPVQALERRSSGPAASIALKNSASNAAAASTVQHQADVVICSGSRTCRRVFRSLIGRAPRSARPLMGQERRAAHEEDRECRQADVCHRVVVVTARSTCACPAGRRRPRFSSAIQFINQIHPAVESSIESGHKARTAASCGTKEKKSTICGILDSLQRGAGQRRCLTRHRSS